MHFCHVSGVIRAGSETIEAIDRNDYAMAGLHLVDAALNAMGASASLRESRRLVGALGNSLQAGNYDAIRGYLQACFAAGTPILGEHDSRPVEEYRVGDNVWARDENDPNGPLVLKRIEECFVTEAPIWHLHIGGQVIRTTDEHPFWVEGRGWTAARELMPGDRILGPGGESAAVEEVFATGVWETVYNFRVAEYHTYFIGEYGWGFALWAHNQCFRPMDRRGPNWDPRPAATNTGVTVYGRAQRTTSAITDPHANRILQEMDRLAAELEIGSYIVLNRSVRTGLRAYPNNPAAR